MKQSISTHRIIHLLIRIQTSPDINWLSMSERQQQLEDLHAELDRRGYVGPRPSRQLKRISEESINDAFFNADPMHTGCMENECLDEYMFIARSVYRRLQQDMVIEAAIDQTLCESFGEDMVSGKHVSTVIHALVEMR